MLEAVRKTRTGYRALDMGRREFGDAGSYDTDAVNLISAVLLAVDEACGDWAVEDVLERALATYREEVAANDKEATP